MKRILGTIFWVAMVTATLATLILLGSPSERALRNSLEAQKEATE